MTKARRGRTPVKMIAAANWLSTHPELLCRCYPGMGYRDGGPYTHKNPVWREVADAVRREGFFSRTTSTIDVPVQRIVDMALKLRAATFATERS